MIPFVNFSSCKNTTKSSVELPQNGDYLRRYGMRNVPLPHSGEEVVQANAPTKIQGIASAMEYAEEHSQDQAE